MEGRDLMPNDLFEIVYARVEVQEVREEERRRGGSMEGDEIARSHGSLEGAVRHRLDSGVEIRCKKAATGEDLGSRKSQSLGTTRRENIFRQDVPIAGQ